MELKGSTAIVTGAAKRVGKAIALALAKKGVNIVVHYHHSGFEAEQTCKEIENEGVTAYCLKADLSQVKDVQNLVSATVQKSGKIDILVNSASQYNDTPFGKITEADWDLHVDTNLKGAFFLAQSVAASMLAQKRGKIVNIIDSQIGRPCLNLLPYLVSKAGMAELTLCLARELAPHIQVNAISPGPVLMPPSCSQEMIREIIDTVPLERIGCPEDIASGVLFCLEGSAFMTGAIIPIDGGQSIK